MGTISVKLTAEISRDVRETLLKNLYWIDRAVTRVELAGDGPVILTVSCADDRDTGELEAAVLVDVARIVSAPAPVRHRVLRKNTNARLLGLGTDEVLGELSARGWLSTEAPGVHFYAGLMADLYYGLDRAFGRLARELDAQEVHLPSLLGTQTLLRSGYLRYNAHLVNYVFHLHEDNLAVAQFADTCRPDRGSMDLSEVSTSAAAPEVVLSPAACQPVYRMLSGRQVPGPFVVTGHVRCFRYESGATSGLLRTREYGIREVVYVGTETKVDAFRRRLLDVCCALFDRFELTGTLETASDPFFTDTSAQYRVFQVALELKHEVRLTVGPNGDSVAAASVNHHGDHFGRAWDIRSEDGEIAQSCCLGFGIDRWCLAIFSQFGYDPEKWPRGLQEVLLLPGL